MDNLITSEAQEAADTAEKTLQSFTNYQIATVEDAENAAGDLINIKKQHKDLEAQRVKLKKPILESAKGIDDFFRAPLKFLKDAEAAIKSPLLAFQQLQEKKRREAQAVLDEKARKEREKLEKRAAKAAESGKEEKAEALQTQAAMVVTPVIQEQSSPAGISKRVTWSAEVVDADALLQAVLDGEVPRAVLKIDMAFLNTQARALKKEFNYAGVKAKATAALAARA